jgi:hypothetical protein
VTIRSETRYLIASLSGDEVSPQRLMGLVRGHWSVENGLHFIKDRWWDEDRQWSTRSGLAEGPDRIAADPGRRRPSDPRSG